MNYTDADTIDRHAYIDSVAHRLDPRAKVLATLVFIVTVVSYDKYEVAPLVPFVLFPMGLAILGFVPSKLIAKRILIASPFIVLIGIFNPLLDRAVCFEFQGVQVSYGWVSFASIALRGFLSIFAAVVLVATTSVPRITEALRLLGVPRVLVVQLMLLYRYLFLLIEEARRMNKAKNLRAGSSKTSLSIAASMLSVLLMRTIDRGDAVWLAMKARGFKGELKTARPMKWTAADSVFLVLIVVSCVLLRIFPVTHLLGMLWVGN